MPRRKVAEPPAIAAEESSDPTNSPPPESPISPTEIQSAVKPAASSQIGHVFTEDGLRALELRETIAALSSDLDAELSVTDHHQSPGDGAQRDSYSDLDTEDPSDGIVLEATSDLAGEIEDRARTAAAAGRGTPPTTAAESPAEQSTEQSESQSAVAEPSRPIRRLNPLPDAELASISLEYTSLFADPDPDGEQVLRVDSAEMGIRVLEGYLFATAEPLSLARLSKLTGLTQDCIEILLGVLAALLEKRNGALRLQQVAGGFQLGTEPALADWMLRLQKQRRRPTLSNPAMETLAIVAYRQPITRGEIEAIRGVDSSGALRALQDLGLVEIGGRKDVVGRPSLFVTTDGFLKTFGLMTLEELPPLADLRQANRQSDRIEVSAPVSPPPIAILAEDSNEEQIASESDPAPTLDFETATPEDQPRDPVLQNEVTEDAPNTEDQ